VERPADAERASYLKSSDYANQKAAERVKKTRHGWCRAGFFRIVFQRD